MKLRPDEIANILKSEIERYEVEAEVEAFLARFKRMPSDAPAAE